MLLPKDETQLSLEEDLIPNCGISFYINDNDDIDIDILFNENKAPEHIVQYLSTLCYLITSGRLNKLLNKYLKEFDDIGIGELVIITLDELRKTNLKPIVSPDRVF